MFYKSQYAMDRPFLPLFHVWANPCPTPPLPHERASTRGHTQRTHKISKVAIFLESDGSRPQIALFTVLTVPDFILLLTYLYWPARTSKVTRFPTTRPKPCPTRTERGRGGRTETIFLE